MYSWASVACGGHHHHSYVFGVACLAPVCATPPMQVVTVLLEGAGVDHVNHQDSASRTALLRACEGGHMTVVKLLLEKGAKLDISKRPGHDSEQCNAPSALVLASQRGYIELVSTASSFPAPPAAPCLRRDTDAICMRF